MIVDEIKKLKDELQEKAMALATKVYEEAAKANQAESEGTEEKETKKSKKDDVMDADYEEK